MPPLTPPLLTQSSGAQSSLTQSSGDILADRRFEYARGLEGDGDFVAAADLYAQAVERAPAWAAGWFALGAARERAGDAAGARAAFRTAAAHDAAGVLGAGLRLALLGEGTAPPAPPAGYVRALFDDYAPRFDDALVAGLGYRAPWLLADLVAGRRMARVLDLGCGTGLMAAALRAAGASIGRLDGVDLAPAMIEIARGKGLYDGLAVAAIEAFLAADGVPYDLMLAADVFVYLGDLRPVVAAAAARLAPGGALAFSVEAMAADAAPDGWQLRPSLRYGHTSGHVHAAAAGAGLRVVAGGPAVLRRDRGEPVEGLLFVLEH